MATAAEKTKEPTVARQLANDGAVFVSLGGVAFVVSALLTHFFSIDTHETLTIATFGGACTFVFMVTGLLKFIWARQAGLTTGVQALLIYLCWAALVLLGTSLFGFMLPRFLNWPASEARDFFLWTLGFLLITLLPVAVGTLERFPLVRRSGCTITVSWLSLIYCWATIRFAPRFELSLTSTATVLALALGAGISVLFMMIGISLLRRIGCANQKTRTTDWICRATALNVCLMIITLLWFLPLNPIRFLTIAATLFLGTVAIVLGSLLAHWRHAGRISIRRRILVTTPVLILAFPLVVAAGTYASLTSHRYYLSVGHDYWVWHVPEILRAPIVRTVVWAQPNLEKEAYTDGLVSTAELREAALTDDKYHTLRALIWLAWCERDPESALSAGLAIPPLVGSEDANSPYDYWGAGMVIGKLGTDDDIRARLTNNYGTGLAGGTLAGLLHIPERASRLRFDVIHYFTASGSEHSPWYWFLDKLPADADAVLKAKMTSSGLKDYGSLRNALGNATYHIALKECALSSDDVVLRKIAIENYVATGNSEYFTHMLKAARGLLPNSDADEQRASAHYFDIFFQKEKSQFSNFTLDPLATPTPLTPQELDAIDKICKDAEEKLKATSPFSNN